MTGHAPEPPEPGELDDFAADILRRCQSALAHHGGHPNPAWSTGERLAVALVLGDRDHLDEMDYTVEEAMVRVHGGMWNPPGDMGAWLAAIRPRLPRTAGHHK